ncbi:MAG: Gfo/Idh/MocA family oxidoreductase [Opitutaceae bacterium]|nr:Gfo/Idh/MocA family oxidoreductase [Opitutaceae bacterium]
MDPLNRRQFLATTTVAAAAAAVLPRRAYASLNQPDKLRLGLIGCGGRGVGAVADALLADAHTELVAVADVFADQFKDLEVRLAKSLSGRQLGAVAESVAGEMVKTRAAVPADRRFSGFDAYTRLCALDTVDVVLMAAPPVFRPLHLEAALAAGKHVFMEKPVCVDPVGVRKMLELAAVADAKKLSVVAGTQRRHEARYLEGLSRVRDGQIGEIVGAQCFWLSGHYVGANLKRTELPVDEMEYQLRNWLTFIWTSGDHIVEQHMHNIDVILWALGKTPTQCVALGGRGVDLPVPAYGNRFSHFAAEFDFGGLIVSSYCRQEPGTYDRVAERIIGTKGVLNFGTRRAEITGEKPWTAPDIAPNPYVQEHADLVASIRAGRPLNEIRAVTESTAAAMLARESAYTGRALKFDWLLAKSQLNHTPQTWAWGPKPIAPMPVPGKTELV